MRYFTAAVRLDLQQDAGYEESEKATPDLSNISTIYLKILSA